MKMTLGKIVKIDNTEEPPIITVKTDDGNYSVYSIDDINIVEMKDGQIRYEPFNRDKRCNSCGE